MMEYGNGKKNQLIWKTIENRYHNDNFEVKEDNLNVNVSMLSKYVRNGQKILDIGCGEGKFGIVLSKKKCTLVGVDIDQEACNQAMKTGRYDSTYVLNFEMPQQTEEEYQKFEKREGLFDVIALIDVLEHVINPTAVICNSIKQLKDGGTILISIPNINNADIFLNLLCDKFNYQESGVLDNTHTKYFTKNSFIEWIIEINQSFDFQLDCEYIGSTYGYTSYMEQIKKDYPKVYQFIQLNPYFHAIQHLFVLTYKKDKMSISQEKLESLLQEKPQNLVGILENLLNVESLNNQCTEVCLLKNERQIMEEEIESAENGWIACSEELKRAHEYSDNLLKNIDILKKENERLLTKDIPELRKENERLLTKDILELRKENERLLTKDIPELRKENERLLTKDIPELRKENERLLTKDIPKLRKENERLLTKDIPELKKENERLLTKDIPELKKENERLLTKDIPELKKENERLQQRLDEAIEKWKECADALKDRHLFEEKLYSDIDVLKKELENQKGIGTIDG